ncbi:MAG: hypothetical protein Aurels2KO_40360 [Aureliella sp.]
MESILFESPVWLGMVGFACAAVAGYFWSQTGSKPALISAIVLAVLTIVGVMVNLAVDTDRETISKLLDEAALKLKANDHDAVLDYLHPAAGGAVQRAKAEIARFEFSDARVTRIKDITVNWENSPPTALAEFNAVVKVSTQGFSGNAARFVKLYFHRKDDRWLVVDYEHASPTEGFKRD